MNYICITDKVQFLHPMIDKVQIFALMLRQRCNMNKLKELRDVNFCYLFGSYAKAKAKPTSDVDLLISANVKGLKFYGLVEEIRLKLNKKVDVLEINQLNNNIELTEEILKDGIKIYG